jgi:penicillin-binding protein 1A
MKYLWYAFLGLFSLGFLGLITVVMAAIYAVNYYGQDLPDYSQLKDYKPPIVTRLYAGDGRLMAEFAQEKRVFVPINEVPDIVKQAFIAAEDKNFYTHPGIDFTAIARAALSNIINAGSGRRPVGASTITQQVAKNFLLTNEVSYTRKIKEAILAYRMEQALSKDRLLELYLNQIFLGARSYGVAAASMEYFNKSLPELSIEEAAYLAALPKAPNNYHPVRKYDAALARRNWVIERMREDGYINNSQAELATIKPLKTVQRDISRIVSAPYFAEEVRRELAEHYGAESLYGGGLSVRTTIDPKLQDIAERSMRAGLQEYDRRHGWRGPVKNFPSLDGWQLQLEETDKPAGMLEEWDLAVVLESSPKEARIGLIGGQEGRIPLAQAAWARKCLNECYSLGPEITGVDQVLKTGDVVMVSSVVPAPVSNDKNPPQENPGDVYELQQIPLVQGALIALDPHTGRVLAMQGGWKYGISEFNRATQAKRQPGSAFKPFVYLAALDKGFTPATLVMDGPFVIEDRPGHFWSPTNYKEEYYGPTPIRVGVEKSKNLMTVRLADYIGMDVIAEYAERFGITDKMPHHLSNALGAGETTLLRMTAAYGVLVNGGKKIEPSFIDRIQDRRGSTVFRHDARACEGCGHLIRWEGQNVPDVPDTRAQIADPRTAYQMVSILEGAVERGTALKAKELGRPLAGKTGTTNESKDTWFIGFSPDLLVGVFMGFDEPRSLGKRETGASAALPVWISFMKEALVDTSPMPFRIPPGIRNIQVNAQTGALAEPGDTSVIWESFVIGTEPTEEMYILDEGGIRPYTQPLQRREFDAAYDGDLGAVDGFEQPNIGQDNVIPGYSETPFGENTNENIIRPPEAQQNPATTGTGGLY